MRELLLLRHAEAMDAGPDGTDVGRPLSVHGEAQARAAGAWLAVHHAAPDAVLCSSARRAQMTADALAQSVRLPELEYLQEIYEATPGELLTLLDARAPAAHQVLLVGHNPGLEQLLALLTAGRSERARGMPPAAVAWIELPDAAAEPGQGRLRALWSP